MNSINYSFFNNEKHATGFKSINAAWIEHYFGLEEIDLHYLDNPQSEILDKGGFIMIAESGDKVVGTCAMIKMQGNDYDFELAKMGVDEKYRGLGIANQLADLCIQKAKELGAKKIYLESNSKLKPALKLYRKLGFKDAQDIESPYCRCDVQMSLVL